MDTFREWVTKSWYVDTMGIIAMDMTHSDIKQRTVDTQSILLSDRRQSQKKRIVYFHLYELKEQAKTIYGDKKKHVAVLRGW